MATFTAFVVTDLTGSVIVHDRYQNYDSAKLGTPLHQLCCAHLLRDLADAAQVYPDAVWPTQIADAPRGLIHHANLARKQNLPAIPADIRDALLTQLRNGMLVGLSDTTSHTAPAPGNARPGSCWKSSATAPTTCCASPTTSRCPPTSNQAERDLRPSKIQQKISGRLTSEARTRDRYTILGYLSTAAKHGLDKITLNVYGYGARGVLVTYESIHQWCRKFGQAFANGLRRRRPRPGDKWYLDEVFIKINGKIHYLWRAVDQDGNVLDILVTSHRDAKAATRFFRKLLRGLRSVPRVLVTDKLASYPVAHRRLMRSVEHRRSKYLNNRAENSHQPTRQRERAMKKFTSPGGAQRFLSAFSGISPHFRPRRHRLTAAQYRHEMTTRFTTWNQVTGLAPAAA